jgi:hypothetical protein
MCEALKTSSTIASFSAADTDMNPEAVALLADAIKSMATVTNLDISGEFACKPC